MPSNPLEALKKATSIGPNPSADPDNWMRGEVPLGPLKGLAAATTKLPKVLEDIFAKNPAARGVYEKAMKIQLDEVAKEREVARTANYARDAKAYGALLETHYGGRPQPIPTKTGWLTAIPKEEATRAVPATSLSIEGLKALKPSILSSKTVSGPAKTVRSNPQLRVTPDIVRNIREAATGGGSNEELATRFGLKSSTVRGIVSKDTWSWVK